MAYTRKAPKVDIRSLNIKSLPEKEAEQLTPSERTLEEGHILHHDPRKEIRRIVVCSVPLIVILLIISYLDTQKAWVVPLAERLMRFGS